MLGIVAAVLLVLLLAALLLPVVLSVHVAGDSATGFAYDTRIRVLGVVPVRRRRRSAAATSGALSAAAAPSSTAQPADAVLPEPDPAATTTPARDARWQRRARRLRGRAALLQRVLERGVVRIDHPTGWIEYALDDVAETGQFYGFVCATSVLVDPHGAVSVTPLWSATNWLAADVALVLRVQPLRLGLLLAPQWLASRRGARAEGLRARAA